MKYGQPYLSSSYGATRKPSILTAIVEYTTQWKKEAVGLIDTWTRN